MKRFTDTARFDDPWFQSLPTEMKLAWEYVWAKCDNAGVWIANYALADFQIGKKVDWEKFIEGSEGRLVRVEKAKVAIVGFVEFQCGKLNPECRPHTAVISLLRTHGILGEDGLSIEYSKGINTPQYKDKDQDKEKEQDQDTPAKSEKADPKSRKDRPPREEVEAYILEQGLTRNDAAYRFDGWEANGWTANGKAVKDWKAAIRTWKAGGYFPSQKNNPATTATIAPSKPAPNYEIPGDAFLRSQGIPV